MIKKTKIWIKDVKEILEEGGMKEGYDYIITYDKKNFWDFILTNYRDGEIHYYHTKTIYHERKNVIEAEKRTKEYQQFLKLRPIISTWNHYLLFVRKSNDPIWIK